MLKHLNFCKANVQFLNMRWEYRMRLNYISEEMGVEFCLCFVVESNDGKYETI